MARLPGGWAGDAAAAATTEHHGGVVATPWFSAGVCRESPMPRRVRAGTLAAMSSTYIALLDDRYPSTEDEQAVHLEMRTRTSRRATSAAGWRS